MTTLIDGKKIARDVRAKVADDVAFFVAASAIVPALATILVGEDPASAVYVTNKRRSIREAGMRDTHRSLTKDATQEQVAACIDELAADPEVSGMLLQLPLPGKLNSVRADRPHPGGQGLDGLTTASAGLLARGEYGLRPCTPSGVIELLDAEGVSMNGAHAVVVGRSELGGRPMAQLLLQRGATVTVAHRYTSDLAAVTRPADILVVATGVPGLIGPEHVKPGTTVIDVGIHRTPTGLTGEVRTSEMDGPGAAACAAQSPHTEEDRHVHDDPSAIASLLRARYKRRLPSSLNELTGPEPGVVELPLHIAWSGLRILNLDRPRQRMRLYTREGQEGHRRNRQTGQRHDDAPVPSLRRGPADVSHRIGRGWVRSPGRGRSAPRRPLRSAGRGRR